MSVNLHLAITIRGYHPERVEMIAREIRDVIEAEQLEENLPPLAETRDEHGPALNTRTDRDQPVIISRAYKWVPEFHETLRQAAKRGNGGPCVVNFDCDDADDTDEK